MRDYLALFGRGVLIVTLVSTNTGQIAGQHWVGGTLVGFLISWVWFGNTRSAARTELPYARETYALGAAVGTALGIAIVKALY